MNNLHYFLSLLVTKRNRIVSRAMMTFKMFAQSVEVTALYLVAVCENLQDRSYFTQITEKQIKIQDEENGLVINCMGNTDLSDMRGYKKDLASIRGLLEKADISLAYTEADSTDVPKCRNLMQPFGISLLSSADMISAQIVHTGFGNVGVMNYQRFHKAARTTHVKVELMRCLLALKSRSADYIIVYVGNRMQNRIGGSREAKLYRLISRMGADYIVGVTPNHRDSGITYLKRDGRISRSVYSLGTFLSNDIRISHKRVVLRLKLRKINGKLELFHETYFPYYHMSSSGFVSLILGDETRMSKELVRTYFAGIEHEMRRIRPANRAVTLGGLMKEIRISLPEQYRYLEEFSVGKVCARSFEVMPGDIFFFREAFEDPNDLEPVDHARRLHIAKLAAKKGAMLLISFRELPFECRCVLADNVIEAHIKACAYLRSQFHTRTIGITGSIGKTSTKDMLAEVMKMKYHTTKSERNTNTQVKIGMNIQKLSSDCDIFIQEIGGGRPGGASRHARMVLPEVTVVTNIGDAHIGNFGTKEKLMANKLQIIEGMNKKGVLYLNGDDPLLSAARPKCKTVFYAVNNKNADYHAEDVVENNGSSFFKIVHGKRKIEVKLDIMGTYNILNAVCCYAIGEQFGIPRAKILQGLAHFHTSGVRQNLVNVCGRKFFMDCYNASSESVKSSIEMLSKITVEHGKKRIAVLGDITGMGDLTESIHKDIGRALLSHPADCILLFGSNMKYAQQILRENGITSLLFTKRRKLNHALEQFVNPGDVVLFKGSSKLRLEQSADMVYGTRMTDERLIDESEYRRVKRKGVEYNLFGNYATVVRVAGRFKKQHVSVANRVGSIPVVNIGYASFSGSNIAEARLPAAVRHIGSRAFMGCSQLNKIHLPQSLKYIGSSAFENCRAICQLKLPDKLLHIGTNAFRGCAGLNEIAIPDSVVQIGKNAFADCGEIIIRCGKNSYAQQYLDSENIPYILNCQA